MPEAITNYELRIELRITNDELRVTNLRMTNLVAEALEARVGYSGDEKHI